MLRPWRSLQGRLLALVLGLVAVVWLAAVLLTWRDARHELDELLDSHLAQAAAVLVVQQVPEPDDDQVADTPTLHRYAAKVAFQVFHEGRLVLRSANAPSAAMLALPAPANQGAGHSERHGREGPQGFTTTTIAGQTWRVFATHGSERDVLVLVGEQLDSRDDILHAVLRSMLWPMALALPLLALAVGWAVHRGLAPLRLLRQALAQREPRALQPLHIDDAPAEVTPMLAALNQLFERISTLMEAERRFTADAAHELRTPIAAIRAQAQVALAEPHDDARRHALQATLAGCDRAARLVTQLLTLSRLDADGNGGRDGPATPQPPTDLAAVARGVLADLMPQALARGQSVVLDAGTDTDTNMACPVRADATLLAVMLRNLVDNALRYSPDGARVHASVTLTPDGARLQIDDSGRGLTDTEINRLGERFYRVLGQEQSGSGLGWSIVRRIAATQGAHIDISRSITLGGLCVRIQWPPMTCVIFQGHAQ